MLIGLWRGESLLHLLSPSKYTHTCARIHTLSFTAQQSSGGEVLARPRFPHCDCSHVPAWQRNNRSMRCFASFLPRSSFSPFEHSRPTGEPRREPRWPCLVPLLDRNTAQTEHADLSPVPESPLQRAPAVGVMAAQRLSSDSSAALHVLPYPAAWCRSGAGGEGAS